MPFPFLLHSNRYVYSGKLPFETAPKDDRGLADMHLALYNDVVVFDQATKIIYAISWVHIGDDASSRTEGAVREAYIQGKKRVEKVVDLLTSPPFPELSKGRIDLELNQRPASPGTSNMTEVRKPQDPKGCDWPRDSLGGREDSSDSSYCHRGNSLMLSSRPRSI